MTPHNNPLNSTTILRALLVGLAILLAAPETSNALPNCKPGDTSPLCVCGKATCPTPVKYGTYIFQPAFYVLSLLYAPPGTASSVAFNNTNNEGTTSTVASSFGQGLSAQVGTTIGGGTVSASFGITETSGSSTQFSATSTNSTGAQLVSTSDAIDHTQDRFFLWINPLVTITQTGPRTAKYAVATVNGAPMNVIDISLAEARNPSLIPAAKLGPQTLHGITMPGLSALQASDFATIAAMDKVTSITSAPTDTKRYVYLRTLPLEGPDSAGMDPVRNMTAISDGASITSFTMESSNVTTSLTVSAKVGLEGVFTVNGGITGTLTWMNSTSRGDSSGITNQVNLTLGTPKAGCDENVDVYTDLLFHTMAYVTAAPTCAPIKSRPGSATPPVLVGVLQSPSGQPVPHENVTVTLPNGVVRKILTDSKGRYTVNQSPAGKAKISALGLTSEVTILPGKTVPTTLKSK
jgi:hypothetical protein